MDHPSEIIEFWCVECGPDKWYAQSAELDATIRERFASLVIQAQEGGLLHWADSAEDTLALLILLDQFSRNIFRGEARAFAGDARARAIARAAIAAEFDRAIPFPERQFFFMPLVHSEDLADQDDGVRLMEERLMPEGAGNLLHARVHREIIKRFGRFPYRNEALGRQTTAEEADFLSSGGYGAILREFQAENG